jgi:chromosome segregation ATPase
MLHDAETQRDLLHTERIGLTNEISELKQLLEELASTQRESLEIAKHSSGSAEELTARVKTLECRVQRSELEANELRAVRVNEHEDREQLVEALNCARQAIADLENQTQVLTVTIADRSNEVAVLRKQVEEQRKSIPELVEENTRRARRIMELEKALTDSDIREVALRHAAETADQALDEMKTTTDAIHDALRAAEVDTGAAHEQLAALRKSHKDREQEWSSERVELQKQLANATREVAQLRAPHIERESARQRLLDLIEINSRAEHDNGQLCLAVDVLAKKNNELHTKLSDAETTMRDHAVKVEGLTRLLESVTAEKASLRTELEEKTTENWRLCSERDSEIAAFHRQLDALQEAHNGLQKQSRDALEAAQSRNALLTLETEKSNHALSVSLAESRRNADQVKTLSFELEQHRAELTRGRQSLSELEHARERSVEVLQRELSAERSASVIAAAKLDAASAEALRHHKHIENQAAEITELRAKLNSITDESSRWKAAAEAARLSVQSNVNDAFAVVEQKLRWTQGEYEQVNTLLHRAGEDIQQLRRELSETSEQLSSVRRLHEALQRDFDRQANLLSELRHIHEETLVELRYKETACEDAKRDLQAANLGIAAMHQTLAERHEMWSTKEEILLLRIRETDSRASALADRLATADSEKQELQSHIDTFALNANRLKREVESMAAEKSVLLLRVESATEELSDLAAKVNQETLLQRQHELDQWAITTCEHHEVSERMQSAIACLNSKGMLISANLTAIIRCCLTEIAQQRQMLRTMEGDLRSATDMIETQATALEASSKVAADSENEKIRVLAKLRAAGDDLVLLRRKIAHVESLHDNAEHDCASLRLQCHDEAGRRRRLEDRIDELQRAVTLLKQHRQQDSEELLALQHRTSAERSSPRSRWDGMQQHSIVIHPSPERL